MSDKDNLIVDAATRLLKDLSTTAVVNDAETGRWPAELWTALEESGLTLAWVPDDLGGAGAEVADGFAVMRVAGSFAAPVPLVETLLAGYALAQAGISSPQGPMTVAPVTPDTRIALGSDGRLTGVARQVPFARFAEHIVILADGGGGTLLALARTGDCAITPGVSYAGEPRDELRLEGVAPEAIAPAHPGFDTDMLIALGAAARCSQMAGALQRILDQSVQYATERVQFGKPISKFQVIQHGLAELAGEAAAASAAASMAAEAVARGTGLDEQTLSDIAAAKVRVGEAGTTGSAIAHQVHGAMGFTYEHSLHHSTRRLWSWRDDFGNEAYWSTRLGRLLAKQGADELWPFITAA